MGRPFGYVLVLEPGSVRLIRTLAAILSGTSRAISHAEAAALIPSLRDCLADLERKTGTRNPSQVRE